MVEGDDRLEAELPGGDREHAGAAADVDDAPAPGREVEQELEAKLRCRMGAGPEGAAGVDYDGDRVGLGLQPRGPDPEWADAHGAVKLTPAVLPVLRHLRPGVLAERAPETGRTRRVGVRGQFEHAGSLLLLEAVRKELQHRGARLLGPLRGHGDRDPADRGQRKALFSLSKKPSPPA